MRAALPFFCLLLFSACSAPSIDFEPVLEAEDERRGDDPALRAAIYSESPELRARAATAYGRIAQPSCVDPLLELLFDGDARVVSAAAFGLGQLAWHEAELQGRAPSLVSRLQGLLTHQDEGVRRSVVEAIGKLAGTDAAMLLSARLEDSAASVRTEAALALFRAFYVLRARDSAAMLPPLPAEAMSALRKLAADPDAGARRAAVYLFSRYKDDRFSNLLPQLTRDPSLWVRYFAVQALKRAADGNDEVTATLVAATEDAEYIVRLAAVQALIGLAHADKVPEKLAADASHHVRAAVADALGVTSPAGEPQLFQLWERDDSINVRAAALRNLISRRKTMAEDLIKTAVTDKSWVIRVVAVDGSAVLAKNAEPILMNTIADPDEHVRVSTLAALAEVDGAWAFAAIKQALAAPGLAERGTAVESLGQRQEPERIAAAWSCYQSSSGRRWNDIREALVDVLAAEPGAEGEGYLRQALQDPAPAVVAKAKAALLKRGATNLPELPVGEKTYTPFLKQRYAQNPIVLMQTSRGELEIECFAQEAPVHVANLVGLVQQGFYDGLLWHRVVPNFVIQGGDKEGSGWGDAGYSLRAEVNPLRYERGALGMPRGLDFDSGGAQVFFTHVVAPHLDGQYTVFGMLRRGLEVMDRVEEGDQIIKATLLN